MNDGRHSNQRIKLGRRQLYEVVEAFRRNGMTAELALKMLAEHTHYPVPTLRTDYTKSRRLFREQPELLAKVDTTPRPNLNGIGSINLMLPFSAITDPEFTILMQRYESSSAHWIFNSDPF